MCGLAGLVNPLLPAAELRSAAHAMATAIVHRGPDDEGIWMDPPHGVALSHRRLSILDLSPEGHQPMLSHSRRLVMVFNGEVYNYAEIRQELEAKHYHFKGHSDTEVMLAAIEEWGLEAAVRRFNGMFAFVVWDQQTCTLSLVRDRLGVKPLYYGWHKGQFVFGSELKALCAVPGVAFELDRNSICLFMRHNSIPSPYSIYKGVFKLSQGCTLTLTHAQIVQKPTSFSPNYLDTSAAVRPAQYWSAREIVERGAITPFRGSEEEAAEQLHDLLRDAIRLRMISDVPLGAFLSGGIDSSTVVALMQSLSTRPVKTFSIGFNEDQFNEAKYAGEVARHLGTEHTELYVSAGQALEVIPQLPRMFDEPFSDSSQIPTFLLAQLARKHVTVSLSGDGGDELFGGYSRYLVAKRIGAAIGSIPAPLRRLLGSVLTTVGRTQWDSLFHASRSVLPRKFHLSMPGDKLHKLAKIFKGGSDEDVYKQMVSHWDQPSSVVRGGSEYPTVITDDRARPLLDDELHEMMYFDMMNYLPDEVMVKVDRATMAASLEAREPLLDYRLAEFAWSLPLSMKIRENQGKRILRKVLHRYVPPALVERPKMGFGVPIEEWLRGPLREWGEDLLSEKRLREDGIFDPVPLRTRWQEHQSGAQNWHYHLWDALMFQAWVHQ